jgi:hypothetical protein
MRGGEDGSEPDDVICMECLAWKLMLHGKTLPHWTAARIFDMPLLRRPTPSSPDAGAIGGDPSHTMFTAERWLVEMEEVGGL